MHEFRLNILRKRKGLDTNNMFCSKFISRSGRQLSIILPTKCLVSSRNKCVKHECKQDKVISKCDSLVKCGPCGKHKYLDIRCKVAIVTGGACGIGFSTASELLCQEAYRVIIADSNIKNGMKALEILENAHGKNRVCFVPTDVSKPHRFVEAFKIAHEKYGGADILINNAGIIKDRPWELAIDTNLKSVMRGLLLGLEWMQKEKKSMHGGVVVNIACTAGLDADINSPLLSGTKHGVIGLTKSFGSPVHFRNTGIRIVGLCPGKTTTSEPEKDNDISPELKQAYFDPNVPGQKPEKVAKAVNYIIRYAPTGSIWVAEDSKLYKANMPKRKKFSDVIDVV